MTRRIFAAIALGATLSWSAPTVAVGAVSQDVSPACPAVPAPESMHATIPPELRLLAEKMKHVRLKSIRLSFNAVLGISNGKLILSDILELKRSPREVMSTFTLGTLPSSGKPSSEVHKVLEIGNVSYRYEPTLTRGDGGRPWVREPRERSHEGSSNTSPLEPSLKLLGTAESIVATGTTNIDGQQVSQFTVNFAPGVFPQRELPFGESLAKECQEPVQVNMAIAPSGLPIRVNENTNYLKSGKTVTSSSTTRILATNFHFAALKRPPARQTIGEAALSRFQAAKLSKELAKHKLRHKAKGKSL